MNIGTAANCSTRSWCAQSAGSPLQPSRYMCIPVRARPKLGSLPQSLKKPAKVKSSARAARQSLAHHYGLGADEGDRWIALPVAGRSSPVHAAYASRDGTDAEAAVLPGAAGDATGDHCLPPVIGGQPRYSNLISLISIDTISISMIGRRSGPRV